MRSVCIYFSTILFSFLLYQPCFAQIFIQEKQHMAFGMIPNTDGTCQMDYKGRLSGTCTGKGDIGIFLVSGERGKLVYVDVSPPFEVSPGVLFEAIPKKRMYRLNKRGKKIEVKGLLRLRNPTSGIYNFLYHVHINYE